MAALSKSTKVSVTDGWLSCVLAYGYLLLLLHRREEEIQFTENFTGLQMSLFAPHLFIPFGLCSNWKNILRRARSPGCIRFLINTARSEFAYGECFSYIMLEFGNGFWSKAHSRADLETQRPDDVPHNSFFPMAQSWLRGQSCSTGNATLQITGCLKIRLKGVVCTQEYKSRSRFPRTAKATVDFDFRQMKAIQPVLGKDGLGPSKLPSPVRKGP